MNEEDNYKHSKFVLIWSYIFGTLFGLGAISFGAIILYKVAEFILSL